MIAMLGLALMASAMAAAQPVANSLQITARDYPEKAAASNERGYALYRLVVSPQGTVVGCTTRGRSAIDSAICAALQARAQFQPATDEQGRPSFGVYEGMIAFRVKNRNMPPRPNRSVMTLTVDSLPEGAANPSYSQVGLLVGPAGDILRCAPMQHDAAQPAHVMKALGDISCTQLPGSYRPEPARDANGAAVESVQTAMVRFALPEKP
ncbi:energy transducer TonB [Sphingobium phenoxybenzoativorans]|uniref:energy transducer TonB n=1 Tax=Sphingobium phenoxybenzoativorans TaxID=1592790 RepID=UPI0009F52AFE|nr:energy transducer TonB [Sphingobium phenoxybenzoativorans]